MTAGHSVSEKEQLGIAGAGIPPQQPIGIKRALEALAMAGGPRPLDEPIPNLLVMAVYGGALIAAGALFSVLLGAGVASEGPRRLLEGLGFSAGFFFVILSQATLVTEINVVMPLTLLHFSRAGLVMKAVRFWILTFGGNLLGALAIGYL